MSWSRVALVLGSVLLACGFGVGVEPSSTTANGESHACDGAIPTSWLGPGTPPDRAAAHVV